MAVTSAQLTPVQRRLIPGLTDLLFFAFAFTQLGRRIFTDGDSGWHLWAGVDVLTHGPRAIPDTLSFTRAGVPWRDVQWLGDAILALAHRHAGYFGVTLLVSLVFAATFAWLYRILRRETDHPPAAAAATVLAALVVVLSLLARPLLFSFPLLLAAWQLVRVPGRERRAVVLLPLITALWANLHPTAFLAPALAAFAFLVLRRDRRLLLAALLAALALGATPWGYGWLRDIVPAGENLRFFAGIDEWQSPRFGEPRFWFVFAYLLLALGVRRRGPGLAAGEAVLGVGCVAAALLAARLGPVAAILWAPFLARDLAACARERGGWLAGRVWRAMQDTLAPFERVWKPGLWPALGIVASLALAPRLAPLFPDAAGGFPAEDYPYRAMAAVARLDPGPRVLNSYRWGGYLSWVYGGRWKVFIDGRAGFFAGDVLDDYLQLAELSPGWTEALERRRPDWILLRPGAPLASAAPLTGRWRAAYADSIAVVLVPVTRP